MNGGKQQPAVWFPTIRTNSGAEIYTRRLARHLQDRGIRTSITWLPHHAEYAPWLVRIPRAPEWANVVHVNTWLPPRFLPQRLPIVATMHHCVHDEQFGQYKSLAQKIYHRLWIKQVENSALKRASKVIAVSRYTADRTREVFGRLPIEVIHNGISIDGPFQPVSLREPHTPFRLLYVGNWSKRKGSELLEPIMRSLGKGFELVYTGVPSTPTGVEMRCVGKPETAQQLADLYRDADALIFPSRLEGFGLVAIEAQACGLPVIATKGSALPEVVRDGDTGLLCRQDDIFAFVDASRRLASNPALLQRMGLAARTHVEENFNVEGMIERYIQVYEDALAKVF